MKTLRFPFVSFVLCSSVVAVSLHGQTPAPEKLGSAVFDWNSLKVKPTGVGERRDVVERPTATLRTLESHISTLNPGLASHPQHKHSQEEFIILKEGALDVMINGQAQRVGPGSLFFFASNDYHSVQNVGEKRATYLVFNLATEKTRTAPTEGAATSASPDKLKSQVFEWNDLKATPTANGERRAVFNSPTVTCESLSCHITTLNPGVISHAAHRHADEELIVVKEGLVEATINGKAQTAGPGSIFFFASNDLHGLRNAGETRATYYVFRVVTEATPTS